MGKKQGGDAARTAEPISAKGCSTPYDVVLRNTAGGGGGWRGGSLLGTVVLGIGRLVVSSGFHLHPLSSLGFASLFVIFLFITIYRYHYFMSNP